jgi:hypothetical protein
MNSIRISSIVFMVIVFLCSTLAIFANGEGHNPEEKKAEEPAAIDSMYSVKESKTAPTLEADNGLDNMFSPTDLFTQEELAEPMSADNKKMQDHHSKHEGSKVELSRHEWVSFSKKGFGVAMGITLFAGLAFAGLTFMRPGE